MPRHRILHRRYRHQRATLHPGRTGRPHGAPNRFLLRPAHLVQLAQGGAL